MQINKHIFAFIYIYTCTYNNNNDLERILILDRFAIGDKLTYVDLALLQVLRGVESSFPDTYSEQINNFPLLKVHRSRIESRPNLQAYFKSGRSRPMEGNSMM